MYINPIIDNYCRQLSLGVTSKKTNSIFKDIVHIRGGEVNPFSKELKKCFFWKKLEREGVTKQIVKNRSILLPSSASTVSPVESWVSLIPTWSSHPPGLHLAWFSKVLYGLSFQFFQVCNSAQTPLIITFYCIFKLQFFSDDRFQLKKKWSKLQRELSSNELRLDWAKLS